MDFKQIPLPVICVDFQQISLPVICVDFQQIPVICVDFQQITLPVICVDFQQIPLPVIYVYFSIRQLDMTDGDSVAVSDMRGSAMSPSDASGTQEKNVNFAQTLETLPNATMQGTDQTWCPVSISYVVQA